MPETIQAIEECVITCRRCPRLVEWRERVAAEKVRRYREQRYWARPVPAFGDPGAALIIVGLAPAAHGGNRTGRMFTGDRSGDWLFEALHRFGFANQPTSVARGDGLELRNCLITATIRCAPPDNQPLPEEIRNCREYLLREFGLLDRRKVVLALGGIAFRTSLQVLQEFGCGLPRPLPRFSHGGEWQSNRVVLISSYHPSQQNTSTGRLTRPMFHEVFRRAAQLCGTSSGGSAGRTVDS